MLAPCKGGRRGSWACSRQWMMRGRCFRSRRVRSAFRSGTCTFLTAGRAPKAAHQAWPSLAMKRRISGSSIHSVHSAIETWGGGR